MSKLTYESVLAAIKNRGDRGMKSKELIQHFNVQVSIDFADLMDYVGMLMQDRLITFVHATNCYVFDKGVQA